MSWWNPVHSVLDVVRDRYAPVSHKSNFRSTGQITPEEFLAAGDFLVYKFPSWSWSDASTPARRVAYLPPGKQFLITRGVPCHRRLDDNFAGDAGSEDTVVRDMLAGAVDASAEGGVGEVMDGEDEGWLRTGGGDGVGGGRGGGGGARMADVRTLDGSGNLGEREQDDDEDEIPDMEDEEDDDAIIRDTGAGTKAPLRTYTLYITYTPYYRTPRLYLSGYLSASEPLPPKAMMEDIVGDYKDKTVTLEDFPFFDTQQSIKMASVHPCKHASVMKVLLERADAAVKTRRERERLRNTALAEEGTTSGTDTSPARRVESGMEGLINDAQALSIGNADAANNAKAYNAGVAAAGGGGGDEWEVLQNEGGGSGDGPASVEDESAIRVDQYLVVFLKFMAGLMPGIQYDFTMGV